MEGAGRREQQHSSCTQPSTTATLRANPVNAGIQQQAKLGLCANAPVMYGRSTALPRAGQAQTTGPHCRQVVRPDHRASLTTPACPAAHTAQTRKSRAQQPMRQPGRPEVLPLIKQSHGRHQRNAPSLQPPAATHGLCMHYAAHDGPACGPHLPSLNESRMRGAIG